MDLNKYTFNKKTRKSLSTPLNTAGKATGIKKLTCLDEQEEIGFDSVFKYV